MVVFLLGLPRGRVPELRRVPGTPRQAGVREGVEG